MRETLCTSCTTTNSGKGFIALNFLVHKSYSILWFYVFNLSSLFYATRFSYVKRFCFQFLLLNTMLHDMIWYDMIWYDMIWYDMMSIFEFIYSLIALIIYFYFCPLSHNVREVTYNYLLMTYSYSNYFSVFFTDEYLWIEMIQDVAVKLSL